jgi:hypothetical protein
MRSDFLTSISVDRFETLCLNVSVLSQSVNPVSVYHRAT